MLDAKQVYVGRHRKVINVLQPHGIYRARQRDRTAFSTSIISFKSGVEHDIDGFCQQSISSLSSESFPYDYIVRALGSDETFAEYGRPLDYVGTALQQHGIGTYLPEILRKQRYVPSIRQVAHSYRRSKLKSAYKSELPSKRRGQLRVLVLDDVYTTGATTEAISIALLEVAPSATIDVHTLARAVSEI